MNYQKQFESLQEEYPWMDEQYIRKYEQDGVFQDQEQEEITENGNLNILLEGIEIDNKKTEYGYQYQEINFTEGTTFIPRGFAAVTFKDYKKIIKKKSTTKAGYKKKNWEPSEHVRTAIISTHFTNSKFKDNIVEENGIKRLKLG
jgi:hypothetical protein